MEIFLNLAWAALAIVLVVMWLCIGCRIDHSRRSQIIAIAILIAILFPVISVSDDLMAAQNPAETDNCQRRSHQAVGGLHLLQTTAIVPSSTFAGDALALVQYVSPANPGIRLVARPAMTSIANRPPPVT